MIIRSFAKINLGLEVMGMRADGYHEIRTLFQAVSLSDILEFGLDAAGGIRVSGDDNSIPWDERNLVFKAALLLKKTYAVPGGVWVRVAKAVPAGKGLGGGSSNAAMTLFALNRLWALGLSPDELVSLGVRLGADVPFFLEGGLCLGEGRGDVLTPLPDLPALYCVLALPEQAVSSADVYACLRLTSPGKDSKIKQFLTQGELGLLEQLENTLEETVFSLHPRLKEYKDFFLAREAVLSLMSGSGAAVFGLYRDKKKAEKALAKLKGTAEALLVETLSRERYWREATAGV
ncbi:MAG: 4-(cytidine 5'-diphospho)-2-C-methyl-D-erythritol kinase [Candidatus Aminicenantes bacterium]|nr:4-(cytidine 5'-diphospho)-2-C-methyl-D-erythritol kinase [Candidatus Aminicenantes bacterium]